MTALTDAPRRVRFEVANPLTTCQVSREQDRSFPGTAAQRNWVYTFRPYDDVKIRLSTRFDEQAALLEQLTQILDYYRDETGNTITLDQLGSEWCYLPLSIVWKWEGDRRIVSGFSAVDLKSHLPLWGQSGPWFSNFIRSIQQGEAVIDQKLGLPRLRWPSYQECRDICNTVPMSPPKETPDAATNPNWTLALEAAQKLQEQQAMTNQPTAPASELDEFLGRGPGEPPAEDKPAKKCASWVNDPKLRGAFFQAYKGMCNRYNVPEEEVEPIRKVTLIELCEADSLKAYPGTQTELLSALEKQIQGQGYKETTATKSEPQTGHSSDTGNIPPEPPANAVAGKIDSKSDANSGDGEKSDDPDFDKAQFRKERTIKVSGQNYLKAGDRVIMFRADHPDWTLETEALQLLPDFAVFRAMIRDTSGKLLSTGHGFCTPDLAKKVSGRFIEKAETAAIARALSFLGGYGTDDSLDDSDYLADSPVAKAA